MSGTNNGGRSGERILGNYPDGVWLVELDSINDSELVPQIVAALFGLTTHSDISHIDLLINFLRPKSALLILDNCEHLVDACAQLSDTLLKNCPNLKVLVTSRVPLETTGEALYRVPSLGLPDPQYRSDTLRDCEAVKLFEERAQLVQLDFSLESCFTTNDFARKSTRYIVFGFADFVNCVCSHSNLLQEKP